MVPKTPDLRTGCTDYPLHIVYVYPHHHTSSPNMMTTIQHISTASRFVPYEVPVCYEYPT